MVESKQLPMIQRRTVAKGLAWAVPTVAVAQTVPAFAASNEPPSLRLMNTVTLDDYHGIGCTSSLGGSERYWGDRDFRYRVRIMNDGLGGALTEPIKITVQLDKLQKTDGYTQSAWGQLNPQPQALDQAASVAGGWWSVDLNRTAQTATLIYQPPAGGLKPNDWAQASFSFVIADWLKGGKELNVQTDGRGKHYALFAQSERWTWLSPIVAETTQADAERKRSETNTGTGGTGLWYFDGGCGRNCGVPCADNTNNTLYPSSCSFVNGGEYAHCRSKGTC